MRFFVNETYTDRLCRRIGQAIIRDEFPLDSHSFCQRTRNVPLTFSELIRRVNDLDARR